MDRRGFLQRAAALAAAGVAVDQLELLERLAPRRRYVAGWRAPYISYEVKLLNSFSLGYVVRGDDWRCHADFASAAALSGRDVRHELARDIYVVGERTKSPWVFAPLMLSGRGVAGPCAQRMGNSL